MAKKERILELMPHINQIEDTKLRDGVVKIWLRAWEDSEWKDIADCPYSPDVEAKTCDLVQHTNFVVVSSLVMASFARDNWHIRADTDTLLAGALLHDVCKLGEFAPSDSRPAKRSAIGENLIHGSYGVHLILEAGLPLAVAHLISAHTPQVTQMPRSLEGMLICYADYAAADIIRISKNVPLILGNFGAKQYH